MKTNLSRSRTQTGHCHIHVQLSGNRRLVTITSQDCCFHAMPNYRQHCPQVVGYRYGTSRRFATYNIEFQMGSTDWISILPNWEKRSGSLRDALCVCGERRLNKRDAIMSLAKRRPHRDIGSWCSQHRNSRRRTWCGEITGRIVAKNEER